MKQCININCTCECRSCSNMRQYRTLAARPDDRPTEQVCGAAAHVETQRKLPLTKRETR